MSQQRQRAIYALLIDRHGLRPWEIKKLTDRQIVRLYFHPRNIKGEIMFPVEEAAKKPLADTLETEMAILNQFMNMMRRTDYEKAVKQLTEKYGRRDPEQRDPDSTA